MTKNQQLKMVDEAFYAISRALESGRDFGTFYNQNLEEERDHRRFGFGSSFSTRGYGITAPQAARLFCVRSIAEYLNGQKAPDVVDIFSFRLGMYQAYALAETNRLKLTDALKDFDLAALIAVDYAELVAA